MEKTKVSLPNGKGGWTEVEGEVLAKDQKVNEKKQKEALNRQFIEDAGGLTERFAKFANVYCKENGLEKEHLAFSAALFCVNLREDYPGGKDQFDALAVAAAEYYDANAPRAKVKK